MARNAAGVQLASNQASPGGKAATDSLLEGSCSVEHHAFRQASHADCWGLDLSRSTQTAGSPDKLSEHRIRMAFRYRPLNLADQPEYSGLDLQNLAAHQQTSAERLSWTLDAEGFHTRGQRGGINSETMGSAVLSGNAPLGRLES